MSEIKTEIKTPPRTIAVTIQGNDYSIPFPNTGQLMDIEVLKVSFARNSYDGIANARTNSSDYVRFLIDALSTFTVLCPGLKKDLKVENFAALDAIDSKRILDAYLNKVLPWMKEWESVLNSELPE
jgi:hypothetical protein